MTQFTFLFYCSFFNRRRHSPGALWTSIVYPPSWIFEIYDWFWLLWAHGVDSSFVRRTGPVALSLEIKLTVQLDSEIIEGIGAILPDSSPLLSWAVGDGLGVSRQDYLVRGFFVERSREQKRRERMLLEMQRQSRIELWSSAPLALFQGQSFWG